MAQTGLIRKFLAGVIGGAHETRFLQKLGHIAFVQPGKMSIAAARGKVIPGYPQRLIQNRLLQKSMIDLIRLPGETVNGFANYQGICW